MPHNGYSHNLRDPLKGFRRDYAARRQTAKAAHALGPKDRKKVGGVVFPGSARSRQVQGIVMRRAGAAYERKRRIGRRRHSERPSSWGLREAEARKAGVATGWRSEARPGLVRPSSPNPIRSVNRTREVRLNHPERPGSNTEPRTRLRRGRTTSAREPRRLKLTRDLGRAA